MEKDSKKKILFLITKSNWGGAQRYVFDMATNLSGEKYDVVVATGGSGELAGKLTAAAIKVIQIPGLQRDVSLYQELRASWNIANIIRDENPDIIHVNSSKAGFIGAILGRILGVPQVIFTCHGWSFNEKRNWLSKKIMTILHWVTVLAAHITITVSDAVHSQMTMPGTKNKMFTIHNGGHIPEYLDRTIARQKLMEGLPALSNYAHDKWSVTIGELHKTKQHDVTIRAFAEISQNNHNLRHIIIGEGEEKNTLENLIQELNLSDRIFLFGTLPEASKYLKAFDLFILSSRSEALGYVVLEAAQAELPIIASNVGGIPEIVTDKESALLLPEGDSNTLAQAITKLEEDSDLASSLAEAALERSKIFSIEAMVRETEEIYSTQQ